MPERELGMLTCDRCGQALGAWSTSYFNTDTLCVPCKADEMLAPNYERAVQAEAAACRGGNLNFPGIGLSPEDETFLAARRARRRTDF